MPRHRLGRVAVVACLLGAGLVAQPAASATTSCLGLPPTIVGTPVGETITGTPGDDVIDAGEGDDVVRGLGGNDHVCGGGGRDVLDGGPGDDALDGGDGVDTASYAAATAAVTANLLGHGATGDGSDTFVGIENLTGGPKPDVLTGDENANTVDGGPGNDTCILADGADTAIGCESASSSYGEDDTVETFVFTVTAANPVYLRVAGPNGVLSLAGPTGPLISEQASRYVTDPMTLTQPGTYTATVRAWLYQTWSYTVSWTRAPAPQAFDYTIGQVVTENTPRGAGRLEAPGSADLYRFSGRKGQRVYPQVSPVRHLGQPGFCPDLTLTDPVGTSLLPGQGACGGAGLPATVRLPADGTYTLGVRSGLRGHVGGYSLTLLSAPAPQVFTYAPGTEASTSGAGAGVLERIGAVDEYRFVAAAGQAYVYGWQPHLSITGPDGAPVTPSATGASYHRPVVTLPTSGAYVMRVQSGEAAASGAYGLKLYPVPPPQDFEYAPDTEIADDVPGPGAGYFSGPEAVDRYSFAATAGERLLIRSTNPSLPWTLRNPSGRVTSRTGNAFYTPVRTGVHVLAFGPASPDWPDLHYSAQVHRVPPPDRFSLTRPATVSNGVPGAGAGRIEVPGASDEYTFTAGARESVLLHWVTRARPLRWQVFGPEGFPYSAAMSSASGDQVVTIYNPGTYTLRVTSVTPTDWFTGPYELRLS